MGTYTGAHGGAAMTYRGVSAAVVHLLMSARSNGVPINRTKLAKLLYLADLRAVDEGLAPAQMLSGAGVITGHTATSSWA